MQSGYFVRVRGKIIGPFDRAELRELCERGQLHSFHELSTDQVKWTPAGEWTDLFPPAPASLTPVKGRRSVRRSSRRRYDRDDRLQAQWDDDYDDNLPRRRPAPRSGLVDFVGIVHLIYGGLLLLFTLMVAARADLILPFVRVFDVEGRADVVSALVLLVILGLVQSALLLAAGIGTLGRRHWAWALSVVLAGISAVFAVLCAATLNPVGILLYTCYTVVVLAILLQRDYAREFR